MHIVRSLTVATIACVVFGCAEDFATCPTDPAPGDALAGNAGCMVQHEGRMLVVRSRATGKLGVPGGGPQPGETARCTAFRETLEEAGLAVTVGDLLLEIPETDFYLFECVPAKDRNSATNLEDLRSRALEEITEVFWVDPEKIEREDWRFPQGLSRVQEVFRQRQK